MLPEVIQEIVRLVGHSHAMALVHAFGGQELRIPKTEASDTWAALVEVIGEPATGHAAGKCPRKILRELLPRVVHGAGNAAVSQHQRQRVHGAVVVNRLLVVVLLAHIADHAAVRADVLLADARFPLGACLGALCLLGHDRPSPSCPRVARAPSRLR